MDLSRVHIGIVSVIVSIVLASCVEGGSDFQPSEIDVENTPVEQWSLAHCESLKSCNMADEDESPAECAKDIKDQYNRLDDDAKKVQMAQAYGRCSGKSTCLDVVTCLNISLREAFPDLFGG